MTLSPARIAITALLLSTSGDLGHAADSGAEGPAFTVEIEPGLTPRMQPSEVVEALPADLRTKVLSLECTKSQSGFRMSEAPYDWKTVWRVRVDVPFWRPDYDSPPIHSDITIYYVDDAIGANFGRGTGR
jgi:hypothetical protein